MTKTLELAPEKSSIEQPSARVGREVLHIMASPRQMQDTYDRRSYITPRADMALSTVDPRLAAAVERHARSIGNRPH